MRTTLPLVVGTTVAAGFLLSGCASNRPDPFEQAEQSPTMTAVPLSSEEEELWDSFWIAFDMVFADPNPDGDLTALSEVADLPVVNDIRSSLRNFQGLGWTVGYTQDPHRDLQGDLEVADSGAFLTVSGCVIEYSEIRDLDGEIVESHPEGERVLYTMTMMEVGGHLVVRSFAPPTGC